MMFRKEFSLLLAISALFSGQIMAEHKGHEFVYVKNADHQLRHEADSDSYAARLGSLRRGCASTILAEIAQTGYPLCGLAAFTLRQGLHQIVRADGGHNASGGGILKM